MASIQRLFVSILVICTFAFVYFAQTTEAAKGPKITNKVYFDIEHGGESLGRSEFLVRPCQYSVLLNNIILNFSYHRPLRRRE